MPDTETYLLSSGAEYETFTLLSVQSACREAIRRIVKRDPAKMRGVAGNETPAISQGDAITAASSTAMRSAAWMRNASRSSIVQCLTRFHAASSAPSS